MDVAKTYVPESILADAQRHRRLMASVAGAQPALDAFTGQGKRMREALTGTGVFDAFTGQDEKMMDALWGTGVFDGVTGQDEKFLDALKGTGVFDAFTGQDEKMMDALWGTGVFDGVTGQDEKFLDALRGTGVFDGVTGQDERLLETLKGTGVFDAFTGQSGKWLEQVRKTFDSTALFASLGFEQQERHRQLLAAVGGSPAIEEAFRTWQVTFPPGVAERMADFQSRVLAEAAAESSPDLAEEAYNGPWFGEESWSRLVFHMVAVLKCAELATAGMTGAKMGLRAPIPSGVLYLLAIVLAVGELAAHFAEPAAQRLDESSEDS